MLALSHENQANITEAFNLSVRYLDDLLNVDDDYCKQMIDKIYPKDVLLNVINISDTEAPFLILIDQYLIT